MRLSRLEYGCYLALAAKSRSEDPFTKVGAVALSKDNRVLGTAYNGLKPGAKVEPWMLREENRARKSDLFIHAESNLCALLRKGECYTICLTQSPCIKCCQNIAALDIKTVVYLQEYTKCNLFKEFFSFHGVQYFELDPVSKNNIKQYIKDFSNFFELESERNCAKVIDKA